MNSSSTQPDASLDSILSTIRCLIACWRSSVMGSCDHRRIVVVSAVGPHDRRTMHLGASLTMWSAQSSTRPAARPTPGWPCPCPGGDASLRPCGGSRQILLSPSSSRCLLRPRLKRRAARPHGVQHDCQLTSQRDSGRLEAHALHEISSPCLEGRILPHTYQQAGGSLE